jgi:DNA gyrase subunit A
LAKRKDPRHNAPLLDALEVDPIATESGTPGVGVVTLHEAAQSRYLNYALSVITARALPDVRDGLKPVQRRILYTMWKQRLTSDAKPRKCAKVVGDVMGSYHPHGDTAIYDTLVRMAQPFALRYPLVEGSGNFGSLDGDNAAAMRYTECRLAAPSAELLDSLNKQTVAFRPNYDGTRQEPVVLPSRLPTLLINGSTGIAVGMATNIPSHHLGEVCTALLKLIADPELSSAHLFKYIKGPDFPTGGHLLNTSAELQQIYETGSGTLRLRATWEKGTLNRGTKTIYVTSVPYATNKSQIVEQIANIIGERKLPPLLDINDESTDDVRVALELKADADEQMVMAYLFKHTPLQTNFAVNMTCLVPSQREDIGHPERLNLRQILRHFLHFRLEVVTKRLEHELATLTQRIHILEGFEKVFDALDAIIKLIRSSDGKTDAATKITKRFDLNAEQTDAILELKVYRLARLEILIIRDELADKRQQLQDMAELLQHENQRWNVVRDEIKEVQQAYGNPKRHPRRTRIESVADEIEYSEDDFIIEENCVVLVSRDGWIKRQKEVRDATTTRLREGDSLLTALAGSTKATGVFFTNFGTAYTCRLIDAPASTGYGEPIQRHFKLKDGERVVAALSLDPRVTPAIASSQSGAVPRTHALAVSSDGYALRFSIAPFAEPSTRSGRRFARLAKNAEIVGVARVDTTGVVIAATKSARAILCKSDEINFLSGPGKGVMLLKLSKSPTGRDEILGFVVSGERRQRLTVETSRGATQTISTAKYGISERGGKGRQLLQRGQFLRVAPASVEIPSLGENGE